MFVFWKALTTKPGEIIPVVKQMDIDDPVDFFAKLSDYGRSANCCLLESREYLAGTAALSFGTARPSLYLTGTGDQFTIQALGRTPAVLTQGCPVDIRVKGHRRPQGCT